MRLGWLANSQYAGDFVALEKGWFKERGRRAQDRARRAEHRPDLADRGRLEHARQRGLDRRPDPGPLQRPARQGLRHRAAAPSVRLHHAGQEHQLAEGLRRQEDRHPGHRPSAHQRGDRQVPAAARPGPGAGDRLGHAAAQDRPGRRHHGLGDRRAADGGGRSRRQGVPALGHGHPALRLHLLHDGRGAEDALRHGGGFSRARAPRAGSGPPIIRRRPSTSC